MICQRVRSVRESNLSESPICERLCESLMDCNWQRSEILEPVSLILQPIGLPRPVDQTLGTSNSRTRTLTWPLTDLWESNVRGRVRGCGRPCSLIGSDRSHEKKWEAMCESLNLRERPCTDLIGLDRSVRESEIRSANQRARPPTRPHKIPKFLTFDSNSTSDESDVLKI